MSDFLDLMGDIARSDPPPRRRRVWPWVVAAVLAMAAGLAVAFLPAYCDGYSDTACCLSTLIEASCS